MRGGRNKFGPMYKRDRALKQQRKTLMQTSGFRRELSSPLCSSSYQRDLAFTGDLQPDPFLHSIPLPTAQNDQTGHQCPSMCSLLPFNPLSATQYQFTSFSNWTIKLEHTNNCVSPLGSAAGIYMNSDELYSNTPQGPRIPQLVMEFLRCDPDELQLRNKTIARLKQEQTGWNKHRNPSTFSLMCLMADQTLFSIVEWARTSIFFKQLTVNDQMRLLHSCWSELLLLDIISRQVLYGREGSLLLVTGQEVELSDVASHAGPTLASLIQRGQELVDKLSMLKVDRQEFACIKFLILFDPDVKELEDHRFIEGVQEQVEETLLEYTLCTSSQYFGRFAHLLLCLSDLRALSSLTEDYLYCRYQSADVPCSSLLIEMLHAKRS
nr:FTZ-F1b transcript variant 2 [Monopterus albus]